MSLTLKSMRIILSLYQSNFDNFIYKLVKMYDMFTEYLPRPTVG